MENLENSDEFGNQAKMDHLGQLTINSEETMLKKYPAAREGLKRDAVEAYNND